MRAGAAALLAIALLLPAARGQAEEEPQARRALSPTVAGLDEVVQLTLELSSDDLTGLAFEPKFRLDNLELLGAPATSRQRSWINGRVSGSTQLIFRLRPLAVGKATVRDISLELEGGSIALPDAQIEIVAETPPERRRSPRPTALDPFGGRFADPFGDMYGESRRAERQRPTLPKLHLRMSARPATVWVGEQLTWRLLLDTQSDISAFMPRELPRFEGFWVRDVPLPEHLKPEWVEVDGERYGRVPMLQRALFPLRPGTIELGPTVADLVVRVARVGWFGPIGHDEAMQLESSPLRIEVRALPDPPPDFAGVVGPLELSAGLDRTRLRAGEAATLTFSVSGYSHLQSLAAPTLDLPPGLRVFEPRAETSEQIRQDRIRTTRTWSWVVLAERPGRFRLPPIGLVGFDPATAAYRRWETGADVTLELEVEPAWDAAAATPDPAGPTPEPPESGRSRPAWAQPSRIATAAAAGLVAVGLLLAVRAVRRGAPARRRRRELAAAIAAARTVPAREAAARLETAWRQFAADQWQIAPGLPTTRWPERLAALGLPEAARQAVVGHFDDLHFLRYAPELSDVEALRAEAVDGAARLLRELGRHRLRPPRGPGQSPS